MTFIIISLIFWRTSSWAALINRLNMQLFSASLFNIVLILIFLIITLTIKQTMIYMKHKKVIRITISSKCINSVELNFIKSVCTFFSSTFLNCVIILFLISFLLLRLWCCETSIWIIWKKYQIICKSEFR